MEKETMTLKEFEKKYMKGVRGWDFTKFSIICKKCGSSKVEYNNSMEFGTGYYDEFESEGSLVVKCHECGNAFSIEAYNFSR